MQHPMAVLTKARSPPCLSCTSATLCLQMPINRLSWFPQWVAGLTQTRTATGTEQDWRCSRVLQIRQPHPWTTLPIPALSTFLL